jgi:hypothetical protein
MVPKFRTTALSEAAMERFDRWMLLFALMGLVGLVATLVWVLASR